MTDGKGSKGGCLCGAVRFRTVGASLFCCHCHCHWCRRAHGAAFVTWYGVREENFRLEHGDDRLRWYRSSEQSERGFCAECGTTLFFRSTLAPGEIHIARACTDDEIDRAPQAHVFFEAAATWVRLGDELPRLDRASSALEKYQAIARTPAPCDDREEAT